MLLFIVVFTAKALDLCFTGKKFGSVSVSGGCFIPRTTIVLDFFFCLAGLSYGLSHSGGYPATQEPTHKFSIPHLDASELVSLFDADKLRYTVTIPKLRSTQKGGIEWCTPKCTHTPAEKLSQLCESPSPYVVCLLLGWLPNCQRHCSTL